MAITQTGSVTRISNYSPSGTGDTTVTVPADATLAVLAYGYYTAQGSDVSSASLGGNALTKAVSLPAVTANNGTVGFYTLANPPTGSQTLHVVTNTTVPSKTFFLAFFKGVDTTNPVKSTGTGVNQSNPTTSSMNVGIGDVGLAVIWSWSEPIDGTDGGLQTELDEYIVDASCCLTKKEISSAGTTTMEGYMPGDNYGTIAGIILALPSEGTALPRRALDGPFYGSLRGSVQ